MLKRILFILGVIAPGLIIAYLTFNPAVDISASYPLFHFYIVTFTTFSAAVISLLLGAALIEAAEQRHILAAVAFAFIGSMFFSHGFATPGALIETAHPAIRWSAWLTLFGGGLMFALASLNSPRLPLRATVYFFMGGLLVYWGVAAFGPQYLEQVEKAVAPWHREGIFYATMLFWSFAGLRFLFIYRAQPNRVDGTLALVSFWMVQAAISMHRYPTWRLSWWMYHAIMLVGFLITVGILISAYERVRRFSLMRYFVAASLIITALLALIASALFTQYSYDNASLQTQAAARLVAQNVASGLTTDLSKLTTPAQLPTVTLGEWHTAILKRLKGLPPTDVVLYDSEGAVVYGSQQNWLGVKAKEQDKVKQVMGGNTLSALFPPDSLPAIYYTPKELPPAASAKPTATPQPPSADDDYVSKPTRPTTSTTNTPSDDGGVPVLEIKPPPDTYVVETYTPLRANGDAKGAVLGVLVLYATVPELDAITLNARALGLLTASVTMGLLFLALLTVVRRADRLITSRTNELQTAYTNLRQAENMRDDMTYMIIHDLRNPLSALSASVDLLNKPGLVAAEEARTKIVSNARAASYRMMGLIDDLLSVGKIEAGELKLNRQLVPVARLLAERVEAFTTQAVAEKKTLTFNCAPEIEARLDANLIGRVLDNLINNAFKYTESHGKIQVIGRAENNKVIITVRDDGPGVPDDFKQTIFDKYQQAPNAGDKPQRKGTGLGLAFCRLVVDLHGGEIGVTDAPAGGSDFSFWVPQS